MACVTCGGVLPSRRGRGRPRKYHEGACARAARRARDGVQRPHRDCCQLCGEPLAGGRYYCPDCALRADRLNRAHRDWLRRAAPKLDVVDPAPAGAGEILPGMPAEAVRWRRERLERLDRLGRPAGP